MATEIIRIGKTVIEKEVPDPRASADQREAEAEEGVKRPTPKPALQLQQDPLPEEEVKPRRRRVHQDD